MKATNTLHVHCTICSLDDDDGQSVVRTKNKRDKMFSKKPKKKTQQKTKSAMIIIVNRKASINCMYWVRMEQIALELIKIVYQRQPQPQYSTAAYLSVHFFFFHRALKQKNDGKASVDRTLYPHDRTVADTLRSHRIKLRKNLRRKKNAK